MLNGGGITMNKKVFIVLIVLLITSSSNLYLFNDPPNVIVETSPVVYSGIPFGHSDEYDLEDLNVKIYASDPDGDDFRVLVMFGFLTFDEFAFDMLYDYREQLGLMVKTEMALTAQEVYLVGHEAMEQLTPPKDAPQLTTPWYELIELEPGFYEIAVDLNLLDVDGQLKGVDVYVQVIDESDNASEEEVHVPIDVMDHPGAANLLTPPANPDYICPPQPTFTWSWPDNNSLKSYQFRLAKDKDSIWEMGVLSRFTYSWRCEYNNECSKDYAPDDIYITSWTPPKPLKAGIYSWGIVASYEPREQKFNPPKSDRSPSFHFTVDPNLGGHECGTYDDFYPSESGQSEEQDSLVEVPNIVGLYVSDMNEFMDDIPLKFITLSDYCPSNRKLIIDQEPKSGELVERMSILEGFTTCEDEFDKVQVPDLVGRKISEVAEITEELSLQIEYKTHDCTHDPDIVVDQEPNHGELVEPMNILTLWTCTSMGTQSHADANIPQCPVPYPPDKASRNTVHLLIDMERSYHEITEYNLSFDTSIGTQVKYNFVNGYYVQVIEVIDKGREAPPIEKGDTIFLL
jgi:hypothetical protein